MLGIETCQDPEGGCCARDSSGLLCELCGAGVWGCGQRVLLRALADWRDS